MKKHCMSTGHADDGTIPAALANFDKLPDAAYVRLPIVCALFCISAPTAWRWVKSVHLTPPKKIGPNTTAWKVGDLRSVQAQQAQA